MKKLFFILPLLLSCGKAIPKEKQEIFCVLSLNTMVCCKKILWGADSNKDLTECDSGVKQIINATNIIIYE